MLPSLQVDLMPLRKWWKNAADTKMATGVEAPKTIWPSWNITELAEYPTPQRDMSLAQAGTMAVSTIWIIVSAWLSKGYCIYIYINNYR